MGKTIKSARALGKVTGFLIGAIPGSIRLGDEGLRKMSPDFMEAIDASSVGSLLLGDSQAHDHVIDSLTNMFEGQTVSLNSAEIKQCEDQAKTLSEQAGVDYEVALAGYKASALETKRQAAK